MRRSILTALALLTLAAILSLPIVALYAVTTPIDDAGRPMPVVSFIGSGGQGTPTSTSDRFPVDTGPAATSSTDPTGWGRRVFTGTGNIVNGLGVGIVWVDDSTLVGVGAPGLSGANTMQVVRSSNRGITWSLTGTVVANPTPGAITGMHQVAGTGFFIVTGGSNGFTDASIYRGTLPGGPFTQILGTGAVTGVNTTASLVQQGSTLIASGTAGAGNAFICRSTNQGASFSCVQPAGITSNINHSNGIQRIASPAANVWLALGDNGTVFRSTDDGATWATAQALTPGVLGIGITIACLDSTRCIATRQASVSSGNMFQSTDAGVTWTHVAVMSGAPIVGLLNYGEGIAVALVDPFTANTTGMRSNDFGATWQALGAVTPAVGGSLNTMLSTTTRNGRAVVAVTAAIGSAGVAPLYTVALGQGDVGIAGANGVRLDINNLGHGGAYQGSGANATLAPWQTTPVQGATLFNTETTGAANTAVVATIAALANTRAHLYRLDARCSAGTAQLTVQDGATTRWSSLANSITTALFATAWNPGLTGTTNTAMTITLSTCGAGNTGTLTVQADRF